MLRGMLSRVAAAAGRRADDCARLRRLVDWARRPPCDSLRRAERRPGKAEGAGWLAQWDTAAAQVQQTWLRPIRRADGAEWSIDVLDRAVSAVRSTDGLQQWQGRDAGGCSMADDFLLVLFVMLPEMTHVMSIAR